MFIEQNNTVIFEYPDGERIQVFPTADRELLSLLSQSRIMIKGCGNQLIRKLKDDEYLDDELLNKGISVSIIGNNNTVSLDRIKVNYYPERDLKGLKINIGGGPDDWLEKEVFRSADDCRVSIGENTQINGAMIYLQDNGSCVDIGRNTMLSWGIDIWCTDAHTIFDDGGNILNEGRSIEIGDRVWIGKDVKIGKNTRICSGSIVGWGSIVTKAFDEEKILIAGVPAKKVRDNVSWDPHCINLFRKGFRSE